MMWMNFKNIKLGRREKGRKEKTDTCSYNILEQAELVHSDRKWISGCRGKLIICKKVLKGFF
jgi:hypothetical protein